MTPFDTVPRPASIRSRASTGGRRTIPLPGSAPRDHAQLERQELVESQALEGPVEASAGRPGNGWSRPPDRWTPAGPGIDPVQVLRVGPQVLDRRGWQRSQCPRPRSLRQAVDGHEVVARRRTPTPSSVLELGVLRATSGQRRSSRPCPLTSSQVPGGPVAARRTGDRTRPPRCFARVVGEHRDGPCTAAAGMSARREGTPAATARSPRAPVQPREARGPDGAPTGATVEGQDSRSVPQVIPRRCTRPSRADARAGRSCRWAVRRVDPGRPLGPDHGRPIRGSGSRHAVRLASCRRGRPHPARGSRLGYSTRPMRPPGPAVEHDPHHETRHHPGMARSCDMCGKTSMGGFNPQSVGMNRVRAHRRYKVNLQPLNIERRGVAVTARGLHALPPDAAQDRLTPPVRVPHRGAQSRPAALARSSGPVSCGTVCPAASSSPPAILLVMPAPHLSRRCRRPSTGARPCRMGRWDAGRSPASAPVIRRTPSVPREPQDSPAIVSPGRSDAGPRSRSLEVARSAPRVARMPLASAPGSAPSVAHSIQCSGRGSLTHRPSTQRPSGWSRIEHTDVAAVADHVHEPRIRESLDRIQSRWLHVEGRLLGPARPAPPRQ